MTGAAAPHPLDFADTFQADDDAPGIGIGAQIQRRADLVDVLTGWSRLRSPLAHHRSARVRLYHLPIRPRW